MSPTRRPGNVIGDRSDRPNGLFAENTDSSFATDLSLLQLPGIDRTVPSPPPSDGDVATVDSVAQGQHDSGTSAIHDVVFIDSRVPDIQDLLNGLKPGEQAFVINGNSDGLDQIATILNSEHLGNLTGIQIVAHGAAGELELGSTMLTDSALAGHAGALATIGSALASGGDLSLYACDTAQGATGQQFIADLSHLTGATVAAATHDVGSADLGGSWTLDASTGPVSPAETGAPFTAAALSSFDGVLAAPQGDEIFTLSHFNTTDPQGVVGFDTSVPNNSANVNTGTGPLISPSWIAVDPAHNVYYVSDTENEQNTGVEQAIYVGAITGTLADGNKLDKIFTIPAAANSLVTGVAFDPGTDTLYFGQQGNAEYDPSHPNATPLANITGIFSLNLSGLNLSNPAGPGTLSETLVAYGPNLGQPAGIALDTANHKLYFVDDSTANDSLFPFYANATPTNNIDVVTIGSSPALATSILQLHASESLSGYTDGFLNGIAYDPVNGKLYFTTWDDNQSGDTNTSVNNVYAEAPPAPGTTTLPTALYTSASVIKPQDIKVDAGTGQLFILENTDQHIEGDSNLSVGSIVVGSVTGAALSTIITPAQTSPPSDIFGIALDPAPILTTSGGTVNYPEGQSGIAIDSGLTITTLSEPGENLTGATITITGGLDSAHDVLGFTDQNGITIESNSGGVLTLQGIASATDYQQALDSVTFSTTSTSTAQRSVTFTVTDSVVTSADASTDHVDILTPPVANPDTNADFEGHIVTGNVLANDTDPNAYTLTVTGFTDGGSGTIGTTFHGTYGDIKFTDSSGDYSYAAGASAGELSAIASAATNSHPKEVITYTISDGHGGTAASTLTITLDRAPATNNISDAVVAGTTTTTFTSGTAGTGALHGDIDPDGDTPVITQVQANSGSAAALTQDGSQHSFVGNYGTLSIADNGTYSYTANANIASPTGSHPVDTFTLTIGDNGGGAIATETLAFNVDRAPTLTLNAPSETYTSLSPAESLQTAVTISDPDGSDAIASAKVTLTGGYAGDGDLLSYNGNVGTVTLGDGSTYNVVYGGAGTTETLTITTASGTGTQADYIELIDGVVFSSTATDPTNAGVNAARSASFQVTDAGGALSAAAGPESVNIELAPSISSVTATTTGGATDLDATKVVTITVHFTNSVDVTGTPELQLNDSEVATYTGGSGSNALTFSYTVQPNDNTADLQVQSLLLNNGTLQDGAGHDAVLTNAATDLHLQVDTTVPTVSTIVPAGTNPNNASSEQFTVTFSESVTGVDNTDFTVIAGNTVADTGISVTGSGTTWTVTVNGVTGDGTLGLNLHSSGTGITDLAGNAISGGFTGQAYTVDHTAPTVSTITALGTDPNNANSDQFQVVFSESVQNVVAGDFALTTTNTPGGTALTDSGISVTGSGTTWTVTVNGVAGDGTLRLDLKPNDTGITDLAGNGATAAFTGGDVYTIEHTPPIVTVTTSEASINAASAPATITFTFSEAVSGFVAGDVTATGGTISGLTATANPDVYTATFTPSAGFTAGASVSVTANSYSDLAGNLGSAGTIAFSEDTQPPIVTVTTNEASINAASAPATITFTFSEAVSGFVAGDISAIGGTISGLAVTANPDVYTATFTPSAGFTGGGSVSVTASSYSDLAGNPGSAGTIAFGEDTQSPSVTVTTNEAAINASSAPATITFTFSEAVSGFVAGDITATGGTISGLAVTANPDVYTATFTPSAGFTGAGSVSVTANSYSDPAGNPGSGGTAGFSEDTRPPTVSVTADRTAFLAGQTALVTFTFSEAVSSFALSDTTFSGGTLSNLVQDIHNADVYTATFTPNATNTETGSVQVNAASYTDLAGNNGAGSNALGFTGDTLAPTATAVAQPSSGTEFYDNMVQITLTFAEAITLAGSTPALALNDGGTATYDAAATAALNNPDKLVFDYTVGSSDSNISSLAITGLAHGTITDLAGNPANVAATFSGLQIISSLVTANPDTNHVAGGQTLTVDAAHGVLANDTETDPNAHVVVDAVDGLAGDVNQAIAGSFGTLTMHADGSYSYVANGMALGADVDNFTYTASDGHGPDSTTTLSITVAGASQTYNQVPSGGTLTAGPGNTVLDGSAGNATLNAAATLNAHQTLIGGPGDVLNAASFGQDTFVFANNFGHETINNFHPALDVIQLQQSQFGSIANVLADIQQAGPDSVLTLDASHVITIANIQHTSLTAADFHLV